MEAFALYLFKSVVWLTGFTLVYLLFLRNERYFLLNRIYLLTGIVASILFPFITWHYTIVIPLMPSVEVSDLQITGVVSEPEDFPTKIALFYAYMAGCIYLLYRIIRQTAIVTRVIRQSEILPYRSAKLIRTAEYPSSFSFFSFVFVNPSSSETETNEIVNHELEHVRQRHWIDLVLFELLCTLQWLNPLCWLYGRFIRQNHEYLADQHALQRTVNPAIYRAALLNQLLGAEVISLANSFNYSINKKRFQMMKNTINQPIRKLKLLVVIPLMAAVFYAFATPEYQYLQADINATQQTEKTITGKVIDEKGNPLKGAAVIISGTTTGTITDANGVFILKITDESPIVISHFGYDSQKLNPDTEKEMVITMKPINIGIGEVTVTALGNSSDITTIKGNFSTPSSTNTTSATGLNYNAKNIQGSYKNGMTNLKADTIWMDFEKTTSLMFIDGKESTNAEVKKLNPDNIEFISVLTGESATSKYCAKGKNGVVEVTLKKEQSDYKNIKAFTTSDGHHYTKIGEPLQPQKDSKVYTQVEQMPEFPGGNPALYKFLALNIKYPKAAVDDGIQGKVFVTFVVDKTGKVSDARIVRGVYPSLDQEALRVVNAMPQWKPGKQGGEDVSVEYTLPINFVLEKVQTDATPVKDNNAPYTVVEQMPEFPGGKEALFNFMAANIKYPAEATKKGIQGKVFVSFVVTKTGSVVDAKVVRGVDPLLDQEAIRVVESLPAWIPGQQGGKNVDTQFTMPINFVLEKKDEPQADPSALKGKLIIVPNPTQSQATVTLEGSDYSGKLEVSLFDSYGKLMRKESKNGPSFTLAVNSLTPGTYLIVTNDGSKQYQGNLVVNH